MAEAVVTFFLQKLNDLITQEASLLSGVDEQVRLLRNKLEWMRLFLQDADLKRRHDKKVMLWVRQIQDVTYHAEDVIDEFMVKISQHRHQTSLGFVGSLTRCITGTEKLTILHQLSNQIKEINTTIEEISSNRSNYDIRSIEVGESSTSWNEVQLTRKTKRAPNFVEESDQVGFEDSIKEVKSLLMGEEQRRLVVSIVGFGGLGKSTLAKNVYNNSDVKRHFDCFAWVYVSHEYKLKELLQGIIKCVTVLTDEQKEKMNEDDLKEKLHEYLRQGKRKYLIVLDDAWDNQMWENLNTAFPDQQNGSRVLLTTRLKLLAVHGDPLQTITYQLRLRTEEQSWKLFLTKIFHVESTQGEVSCPSELEDLGRTIVAKCGGVPLAIVVLGGLLSKKDKARSSWRKVQDSISWQLSHDYSIYGIVALSYYYLPYYLKSCFLYFGLFPEAREIRVKKLIQYWVAEGFIERRGAQTLEDIAEEYLEELINRSLIHVVRRKCDGRIETCRIHDLLRDFTIFEAKESKFLEVCGLESIEFRYRTTNARRLSIHGSQTPDELISWNHCTLHLHTFLYFAQSLKEDHLCRSSCADFKYLRVLELEGLANISTLLQEVGEFVHLKYLGLRRTGLKRIPHSIGRLVNLQTLDLRTTNLIRIPTAIWSLTQLRHLYVHGFPCLSIKGKYYLNRHPMGVDKLTNLQTLRMPSGNWIEGGGLGKLRVLKKLVIIGSLVPYMKEISESLVNLAGLRSLELRDGEEVPELSPFLNHKFLYKLRLDGRLEKLPGGTEFFPPNLNKLTLWKSRLVLDPMEILEKLPNLRILNLLGDSYVGKKIVCSEDGFVRLQVLEIRGLEGLEEWIIKEGALINLNRLVIGGCVHLKMLPDGLQNLSTVQELQVSIMSDEFMDRVKENVGGDWEKIKHIPSVIRGSSFS